METKFRADYAGEFVVVESRWSGGHKQEKREWIENPIENQHISGRAACIGSSVDQYLFDYTRLQRHRGGLLGSKKLQTYGVGSIATQMKLDFCVETGLDSLTTLTDLKYQENNVIYTTARNCMRHPGEFYLIPNNPNLLDLAVILYLAAFDGHKEIFMLGYHNETPIQSKSWIKQIESVMNAYPGVIFCLVGESTIMPDSWMEAANTRCLNYFDFVGYCDV